MAAGIDLASALAGASDQSTSVWPRNSHVASNDVEADSASIKIRSWLHLHSLRFVAQ